MLIQNGSSKITIHHRTMHNKLLNDDMGIQDELYFVKELFRYVGTNKSI